MLLRRVEVRCNMETAEVELISRLADADNMVVKAQAITRTTKETGTTMAEETMVVLLIKTAIIMILVIGPAGASQADLVGPAADQVDQVDPWWWTRRSRRTWRIRGAGRLEMQPYMLMERM